MNVSLNPELEKFVNDKVQSGMYYSASEVIQAGLQLLKEQDQLQRLRLEELKRDIMVGVGQIEQGEFTTYTYATDLAEDIKAEGRKKLADRKQTS